MSIVGAYHLDLYCDGREVFKELADAVSHRFAEFPHTYVGKNEADALRQARKDGWKLLKKKDEAVCPSCMFAMSKGVK